MKLKNITKGLVITLLLCSSQANAAVIRFIEDNLTIDVDIWIFENNNPTFPANSPSNTIAFEQNRQYQGAMLSHKGTMRIETNVDYGVEERFSMAYVDAGVWDTDNGFSVGLTANAYNETNGFNEAAWDLQLRFIVEGDDASINLGAALFDGPPINALTEPSWWDRQNISLSLFDETTSTSLFSTPNWGGAAECELQFGGCEIALEDGREYTLTSTSNMMVRNDDPPPPFAGMRFNNASYVSVPEPSTAVLMLLGLAGIAGLRYRRKS